MVVYNNNIKVTYKQHSLKKLRCAAGICHSVLRNRCAFRCRAKVAVDSDERGRSVGRLFQMSGLETAKFLRPMVVAVRLHTQFARGSRPQMPTSSKLNHRLAKLSQIRGASPRRHY